MAEEQLNLILEGSKNAMTLFAEAVALYEAQTMPVTAIQEKLGLSATQLYRLLHRGGYQPKAPRSGGGNAALTKEQDIQLAEEYRQGMSMEQLATKYNVWRGSIKNALRRQGVLLRRRGGKKQPIDTILLAQLSAEWDAGMSQKAIAHKHGLTERKVWSMLRGVTPNNPRKIVRRGWHPHWKGGRRNHEGYVMVLLELDDPLYCMTVTGGYVLEHRLVMARMLGRPLADHETIHHIDGNRSNNEPSNLQLRQGKHGTGVIYHCADCGSFNVVAQTIADPVELL